jgi:hypothetical protein
MGWSIHGLIIQDHYEFVEMLLNHPAIDPSFDNNRALLDAFGANRQTEK